MAVKHSKLINLTMVFVLPFLLLAMGCDRGDVALVETDASAETFMIRFERVAVSPTTVAGTFKASGYIDDYGSFTEDPVPEQPLHKLPSLYGKKILKSARGTIEIEFYVGLSPTPQNTIKANGGFRIVEGSGAYASLQGSGEIDLEFDRYASPAEVTNLLEGEAWYGP